MSTLMFSEFAHFIKVSFIAVIFLKKILIMLFYKDFNNNVNFYIKDSIIFLQEIS